ncbi:flippase [Thermodesulfovibrio sp. 3462-1]|uniref:Flippase n=1 Tax=Thermodesulfovibrio obliviosus TaxID=3118332 RepID=A0AAU8H3N7_9BACT
MIAMMGAISRLLNLSSRDSHLSEILKGGGISFLMSIITIAFGYLFTLIVSRAYGAEAMGILSLCVTFIGVATLIGQLGFETSLVRFVAQYNSNGQRSLIKEVYAKVLKIVIPLSILVSVLIFINADIISQKVFNKPHLETYFRIAALAIVPMVLLNINKQALRGLKRIGEFGLLDGVINYFFALMFLILFSLLLERKTIYPVVAYIVGIIFATVLSSALWFRQIEIRSPSVAINEIKYRKLLSVSISMFFIASMHMIMQWIDTIMLGIFRTEAEVGIYNVALRLANLTAISLFAINSIVAPKFAELYAIKDMEGLKQTIQHSTRLIFWFSAPVLLAFILLPGFFLGFFGDEFKRGAMALIILSIGQFVNSISGSVGYFMNMTGRERACQNILTIATLINILLNYLLIPVFGMIGASIATMISIVFWNLASVVYIKYDTGILTLYIPKLLL